MRIKRFMKRNMFNIPFAILLIVTFGLLSTWELESEMQKGQGHLREPTQTVYAMAAEECTAEYVPSVQEMIINACKDHGIPSDVPLAIARLETGNFTSDAFLKGNNVGGLSTAEIPHTYGTLEDGVNAFVGNLSKNYYGKGIKTIEEIGKKYCPMNAEGWSDAVKEITNEKK